MSALSDLESSVSLERAEELEEISKAIGSETIAECLALRRKLSNGLEKSGYTVPKPTLLVADCQISEDDGKNRPKMMSGFQLTPWKSVEIPYAFPILPEILDPTLKIAAFTHSAASRTSVLNYENLEWVGDSYMELAATLFISQTFPSFTPGQCSQLRERLVKNLQLAEYSKAYDLVKRANFPPDVATADGRNNNNDTKLIKIHGDLFEAYVGAVVLSDPANGLSRAVQWLKELWGMTLRKDIIAYESQGHQDNPMWRLRGDVVDMEPPKVQPSNKQLLREAIGGPGVTIDYLDAAPEKKGKDKLMVFTVGVYLTGYGETKKQLAVATGKGKKDAGSNAAALALKNHGLLKQYVDKKKLLDEIAAKEKAALAEVEAGE